MDKNRRDFLQTLTGLSLAAPYVSRFTQPSAAARRFEPDFSSAHDALRALREGTVSSRELTQIVYQRIRTHNPKVNTFVTLVEDLAMERARQADEARASGKNWGRLHGLPVLIKDAFETAGIRTTCGSRELERNVPKDDAVAVARLKAAGAIVVGKTNLPEYAGDLQSYNEVAGTTNNPWNAGRTPGGSTGGGAAALAAGFGFLELGSDIGGSIRTPCHFCGVYGHKPTLNVVPTRGHIPPLPGTVETATDLNVAGPMARSAQDLILELEVLGGVRPEEALAYRWQLEQAQRLPDRVRRRRPVLSCGLRREAGSGRHGRSPEEGGCASRRRLASEVPSPGKLGSLYSIAGGGRRSRAEGGADQAIAGVEE